MHDDFRAPRGTSRSILSWLLPALVALFIFYALGFVATGGNLAIYRFWMPQIRQAQREVFVQSQAYVQGKITMLTRLRAAYEQAPPEGPRRGALRSQIMTEAALVDPAVLPVELRTFIASLR